MFDGKPVEQIFVKTAGKNWPVPTPFSDALNFWSPHNGRSWLNLDVYTTSYEMG